MKPSLSLSSHYGIAGITVISSLYGIEAIVAWCAKKSGKCQKYSLVDSYLDPCDSIRLVLMNDRSLIGKLESVNPHLVLSISCISHFSSKSSKNYEIK